MKRFILAFLILFLTVNGHCSDYTQSQTWVTGEIITANKLNVDIQGIIAVLNDLDNDNIVSNAAIANSKLNLASISQNVAFTGTLDFSSATITAQTTFADLIATTADINAGTFDGVVGGTTPAAGSFSTVNIDGGTLDGVQIGGTTATGELIVNNASDAADGLGSQGTAGQRLISGGAGANPTWGNNIEYITASDATWDVPSGVSKVYLSMTGGGGGGAGNTGSTTDAGGGGGGGYLLNVPYTVTPEAEIAIVIGAGGAGGESGNGSNGSATTFDTTVTVPGGVGATVDAGGAGSGGLNATGNQGAVTHVGGNGHELGGGGASAFAKGGNYGLGTTGQAGTLGSGGGGTNGNSGAGTFTGGAGGAGICIIMY